MPDVNRQRDVVQEEMRPRNAHFADTDQGRPRDRVGGERQRATLRRQRTIPKLQEEEEDELLGAECEGNDEDVTRGAEEERPGRPARVYLGSEGLDAESLISNDSARLGGPGEGRALDQRLDQLVCALVRLAGVRALFNLCFWQTDFLCTLLAQPHTGFRCTLTQPLRRRRTNVER
jgi:hypothetical protein